MVGFLVLAITLGSLLAAGPAAAHRADRRRASAVGGVTALTGVIELSETAPTLATMLGLAVGIDYALFILSRHRQNLGDGLEPREAAAQATATAGSAVVFAGLTVVIALVGLMVVNIPFLTVMGLAAAGDGGRRGADRDRRCCPRCSASSASASRALNRVLAFRPRRRAKPGARRRACARRAS